MVNALILYYVRQVQVNGKAIMFVDHRTLTDIVCRGKFYSSNNRLYLSRTTSTLKDETHVVGALLEGDSHWTLFVADIEKGIFCRYTNPPALRACYTH